MTDVFNSGLEDLWRVATIVGIMALMVSVGWAFLEFWHSVPWQARLITMPIVAFGFMVVSAIVINLFGDVKPTDGVKFLAVGAWICAVWALGTLVWIIRRGPMR